MASFSIPVAGQTYRLYNDTRGGYLGTTMYLISGNGCQAQVGGGPGNGGEWFWQFEVISSDPNEKSFTAWIFNPSDNVYLSTVSEDGNNRVMCYGYSDTDRKHWKFLWNDDVQKYQIINKSRENVGVGTKYMGSNPSNDFVFVGGDLVTAQYTWNFYAENPPA